MLGELSVEIVQMLHFLVVGAAYREGNEGVGFG